MDSREQRRFWDQHITEWATSAYEKDKKLPFVEEMAKPWRKHLKLREDMAVEIVGEWAPVSVVELGCGMGEFASAFLKTSQTVRHYRAFDIAEPAVAKTRERVATAAAPDVDVDVRVSSVEDLDPQEFRDYDVLVGLGILPYLTDQGIEKLAAIGRGKKYLLDYHPKEATVFNGIHFVYRKVKQYPFYRMYTEPQLVDLMARHGFSKFEFIRRGPLRFMKCL
jgi:SAM-dependent methyltransferase